MENNYENNENQTNTENTGARAKDGLETLKDLLKQLLHARLEIRKDNVVRREIPLVACGVFALISLKVTAVVAIIGLICGYTVRLKAE